MPEVTARTALNELEHQVNQPEVLELRKVLEAAEQQCLIQVIDFKFDGVHDLANHFAVLGEIRGLRRFKLELAQRVDDLTQKLQDE